MKKYLAGALIGLSLVGGIGVDAGAASSRPADYSRDHRKCTPVPGGVSFQVSGVLNRKYVTGADITRCAGGWWKVSVYPGFLGRTGGLNGYRSADIVVAEIRARMRLTQAEVLTIQNQTFCHAVVPYLPGVSSNIWGLRGAQVWDLETYRPGGQSVAKQAATGCNWAN